MIALRRAILMKADPVVSHAHAKKTPVNPNNNMFKIENETDLHYKYISDVFIRMPFLLPGLAKTKIVVQNESIATVRDTWLVSRIL